MIAGDFELLWRILRRSRRLLRDRPKANVYGRRGASYRAGRGLRKKYPGGVKARTDQTAAMQPRASASDSIGEDRTAAVAEPWRAKRELQPLIRLPSHRREKDVELFSRL